jgi:hypothetical protein
LRWRTEAAACLALGRVGGVLPKCARRWLPRHAARSAALREPLDDVREPRVLRLEPLDLRLHRVDRPHCVMHLRARA